MLSDLVQKTRSYRRFHENVPVSYRDPPRTGGSGGSTASGATCSR